MDRYWGGLSSDMIIETGLDAESQNYRWSDTRGSGNDRITALVWAAFNTSLCSGKTVQCKNLLKCHTPQATSTMMSQRARQERDMTDTLEVLEYQEVLFVGIQCCTILLSGITADVTVNCD